MRKFISRVSPSATSSTSNDNSTSNNSTIRLHRFSSHVSPSATPSMSNNSNSASNNNAAVSPPSVSELEDEYKERFKKFQNLFLSTITTEQHFAQYNDLVLLHLNDLEIYLLLTLQTEMQQQTLKHRRLEFYLSEAHFLREFKDTFAIKRESEFIYNVMDDVFQRLKEICQALDPEETKNLFPSSSKQNTNSSSQASSSSSSYQPALFRTHIDTSIARLIAKLRDTSVISIFFQHSARINAIEAYLFTNYLNPDQFPTTWQALHESIEYRYKKRAFISAQINRTHQEACLIISTNAAKSIFQMQNEASTLLSCAQEIQSTDRNMSTEMSAALSKIVTTLKEDAEITAALASVRTANTNTNSSSSNATYKKSSNSK